MTAIVIPNVFLPSTTISSTAMNANFQEVVDGLAASLALDGSDTMTGQVRLAPGTVGSPALAFGADLNLGLYRRGVDNLGFVTGGVLAGHIDSAGKWWLISDVDIGNDLDVGGDVTVDGTLGVTGASTFVGALTAGVVLPTTIELGHASDTTLARASAGDVNIEGNRIYRAGGTDVAVADGGSGSSTAAGARTNFGVAAASAQRFYAQSTSFSTSSQIPKDGTVPQITEGGQLFSQAITATSITNRIRVTVSGTFRFPTSVPNQYCTLAIFVGAGPSAVAASASVHSDNAGGINNAMIYEFAAGVLTAQTISVRAGASGGDLELDDGVGSSIPRAFFLLEEIQV